MAITTRTDKGSELTYAEVDKNFTDLRDGVNARTPSAAADTGVKVWDGATEDFGWHDMHGFMLFNPTDPQLPTFTSFIGGIACCEYDEGNQMNYKFHLPHDYKKGTDVFIHVHWACNNPALNGGSVTWGFECTYAKGHNQGATSVFSSPITLAIVQSAGQPLEHMVAETALSISGGSVTQLDTDILEPDGMFLARVYLDSNDLTVSDASTPKPLAFFLDIHYQSTNVATKNRAPDFYG